MQAAWLSPLPELNTWIRQALTGSRTRRFESTEPNILPNYLQGSWRMRVCSAKYPQIRPIFAVLVRVLRSSVTVMLFQQHHVRRISERACGPLQRELHCLRASKACRTRIRFD